MDQPYLEVLLKGPVNPEFVMLKKLAFDKCDLNNTRKVTLPATTVVNDVPKHLIGQYGMSLKDSGGSFRKVCVHAVVFS